MTADNGKGRDCQDDDEHGSKGVSGSLTRHQHSGGAKDAEARRVKSGKGVAGSRTSMEQRGQVDSESDEQPADADHKVSLTHQQIEYLRSGPLPVVSEFAGYDKVLPGAANRIMKMAEKSIDIEEEDRRTVRKIQLSDRTAENWAMKVATIGFTFLPWAGFATAIVCAIMGDHTATWISALIGAVTAGLQIIDAIKRQRK